MGTIDNAIHFIWVGGTIPKAYAQLILTHLEANYRHYTINLWTSNPSGSEQQLKAALTVKQFKGGKITEKNIKTVKAPDGLTLMFLDSEGPYPVSKFNNPIKTNAVQEPMQRNLQ